MVKSAAEPALQRSEEVEGLVRMMEVLLPYLCQSVGWIPSPDVEMWHVSVQGRGGLPASIPPADLY